MASGRFSIDSGVARPIGGGGHPVGRVTLTLYPSTDPGAVLVGLGEHLFAVQSVQRLPHDASSVECVVLRGMPVEGGAAPDMATTPPHPAPAPAVPNVKPDDLSGPGLRALMERHGMPALPSTATRPQLLAAVAPLWGRL